MLKSLADGLIGYLILFLLSEVGLVLVLVLFKMLRELLINGPNVLPNASNLVLVTRPNVGW